MSGKSIRLTMCGLLLATAGGVTIYALTRTTNVVAEENSPAPETLLPADAVIYVGADGRDAHKTEIEKTAAYAAIYKSGLADVFAKLVGYGFEKSGAPAAAYKLFQQTFKTISGKGLSIAASVKTDVGPPKPWAIIVLHEGGKLEPAFRDLINGMTKDSLKIETKTIGKRSINRAELPAEGGPFKPELGWWKEGKHLVFVFGADAINSATAVADGKSPNITKNPLWAKYRKEKADFTVTTLSWFDLGKLRSMFGKMPVPGTRTPDNPATVNDLLKVVGLHNVGAIVSRSGIKGKATHSDSIIETQGEKTGLLSMISQKPITMQDLPPLPSKMSTLYAGNFDASKAYKAITDMIRQGAKLGPPGADAKVEGVLEQLPAIIGFDPTSELFDTLGNVLVAYDDPGQGPFGIGSAMLIKVKDEKKLQSTLDDALQRAGDAAGPEFRIVRKKKHGRTLVVVSGGPMSVSFAISKGWLSIASYPQSVEAFMLRQDGKLLSWKPNPDYKEAMSHLPKSFGSITVTDPRESYRMIVGLAPMLYSFAQLGLRSTGVDINDLPVSLSDLPPAEVVTGPLFPNVSSRTVTKDGIRWQSRSSLSGVFGADSVAITAVGIALLLPAVQQARQAARRSSSKNNLKQIGLALHNYHDTYGSFPRGSVDTKGREPKERLSWMASVLPFVEQNALYQQINFKKGWEDDANPKHAKSMIQVFQNPGVAVEKMPKYGSTHYVGIAGVGANSLTTAKFDKKNGIFGYNRKTRIRDITDGTSNTMMVSEASKTYGPWASGGQATIRAFTKKPYINGPDGIGGPWKGGFQVLFADGSVRFISGKIDPKVLEALATMAGGEVVGKF